MTLDIHTGLNILAAGLDPRHIVAVVLVLVAVCVVIYVAMPKKKSEDEEMLRRMQGKKRDEVASATPARREKGPGHAAGDLLKRVAPALARPVMPLSEEDQSMLKVRLQNAGYRRENAAMVFLAAKMIVLVLVGAITGVVCWTASDMDTQMKALTTVFAAGAAFMLPNVWLSMAVGQRGARVVTGLPDCLDLMVISVEAGLGLDAAIQRVSDEMGDVHPDLSEEFTISVLETQMGVPRSEALENLAIRTGVPEVKSLVAIITQAERFGTSIANALRNQADAMRVKRRQKAEEQAAKCAVKLLLPLIMFIFPALFVVLVGPAVLNIIAQGKSL